MGSGKTIRLLVALYQYEQNGKKAMLIKPKVDVRNGAATVWSRVPGLTREADLVLGQSDVLTVEQLSFLERADCCFVEESQFLHPKQVEQLSWLSLSTPVICYGLRSDYRGQLFAGSRALFTWADCIEEIKNVCKFCKHKSTHNLKLQVNPDEKMASVQLGADDVYVGVCKSCFYLKQSANDPALGDYKIHEYAEIMIHE